MRAVFAVGDIHGHLETLTGLLQDAGLIGADRSWTGADTMLWFLGDLTDRGPDGIGVVEVVMRLQREAPESGGEVNVLLGNHDVLLVAASRFGSSLSSDPDGMFRANWMRNGGRGSDLARLTSSHTRWLTNLPAMALVENHLLVHADAVSYTRYGQSIAEVNRAVTNVLHGNHPGQWDRLLGAFTQRFAFADEPAGTARADAFLRRFGGQRIVHGHTPIALITGQPAATVREPFRYAGGRCVNLDGGMFLGGSGFLYRLAPLAHGA